MGEFDDSFPGNFVLCLHENLWHFIRTTSVRYTSQNLPRITFTMSCQHFPPKHIFKFLVNQCWKLIQRSCLKVSLPFLSPLFQYMHQSMSTLKFDHSRKCADCSSMYMSILTLVLRISFSHCCFFFSKPMYLRVTIEFWRNFRKL